MALSRETALFIFSGKILDRPFDLDAIDAIQTAVDRELSARGVLLVRRVVTLSDEHISAAPWFLRAGFEAVPADDEDMQAAAIACSALVEQPVDELVFALGDPRPICLMRFLAGKARRMILAQEKPDDDFARSVDGYLELRDVLSKEGFKWETSNLRTWNERGAAPVETPRQPAQLTNPPAVAPAPSVDELCQTQEYDPFDHIRDDAELWNQELEDYLLKGELKCSASQALEYLDSHYPGIKSVFEKSRDDFRKLLDMDRVRLVEEETGAWFFHPTHEEMRPSLDFSALSFNSAITEPDSHDNAPVDNENSVTVDQYVSIFTSAETFEDFDARVDVMIKECEWSAKRFNLVREGGYSFDELESQDSELESEARAHGLFLWPIGERRNPDVDDDEYRAMAERYRLVRKTFRLVATLEKYSEDFDVRLAGRILQLAADSQCLVKSALRELGVSINRDSIQRDAFKLLMDFRKNNFERVVLNNMRIDDVIELDRLPELLESADELGEECDEFVSSVRASEKAFGQLKYHCGRLRESDPQNNFDQAQYNGDWQKVVECVTTLCHDFKEPYSSIRFREALGDLTDDVPDSVDTTEEFARVRQEIDLFRMQDEERAEKPTDVEEEYSSEILAVRRHYNGGKAVFVGGTPMEHLRKRIEKKLGLELIWEYFDHGDSLDRFRSSLNSSSVKLFLVYIPWCSHKHTRELADIVRQSGKDFVRLPKGTSPEQIAVAICNQVDMSEDDCFFDAMDAPELLGDDE